MKRGRAGTMTHDYIRHGTTTLFAALNLLDGMAISQCIQRHRNQEFLRLERDIPAGQPPRRQALVRRVLNFDVMRHGAAAGSIKM